MNMRRRNSNGGFPLIFIFLFFIFGGDILAMFLPFLIFGLVGWVIYKSIDSTTNRKTEYKRNYQKKNNNTKTATRSSGLSNADFSRIDKKLTSFFKENLTLPVIDEVSLVTTGGNYTNIDSLFLTYKDEKVTKMSELKDSDIAVYNKILSLLVEFSKQSDEVLKAKVDTNKESVKPSGKKLSDGEKYIELINELNEAIPQEEITNGLYQTCDLLRQIELSDVNASNYDKDKISKLYDYYLPILTGILENYKKLQDSTIKGEEFKKCEAQLIKTIILINQALKTIYSDLHADDYMNINADISTLQTLLKKDGYDKNPFEERNND